LPAPLWKLPALVTDPTGEQQFALAVAKYDADVGTKTLRIYVIGAHVELNSMC
jgi:hypothetical protein